MDKEICVYCKREIDPTEHRMYTTPEGYEYECWGKVYHEGLWIHVDCLLMALRESMENEIIAVI